MITTNVLTRVFFIRAERYGSAFTIDHGGKQYLVTARHLLGRVEDIDAIFVFHDREWKSLPVQVVGVRRDEPDIAVLSAPVRLSPPFPLEATSARLILGQDVYFAGYPYKMWVDGGDAMGGRPVPFVKKGSVSNLELSPELAVFWIDALNNEGFSGGPLLYRTEAGGELKAAGVVSRFKTEHECVLGFDGEPTGDTVEYNTGFLVAYGVRHALELIDRNPIGFPLDRVR